MTQEITPLERYLGVKQDMQDLAQQLLIFGTHVHVGIEDREFLIDAMNVARYFLPHILCLSSSSPFWMGRNTGLKSYRSVIFRNFPRTGVPRMLRGWARLRVAGQKRWWKRAASPTAPRSTGTCARTGSTPRWSSASATSAPASTRRCAWRPSAGHHRQAVEAAARQHDLPRLPLRPDRGEQVAGGALRAWTAS
jgi:hypothetical protein